MKNSSPLAAIAVLAACVRCHAGPDPASTVLWYSQSATEWMTQALPVGNGSLGAMIFGGLDREHIQFNEISLWEGDDRSEGTGAYQAFGDILIDLSHGGATEYRRELDINAAVHGVAYKKDRILFTRTCFASHPAGVLVLRLEASARSAYTGRITLADMHKAAVTAEGDRLRAVGKLANGLEYEAQLLVLAEGGSLKPAGGQGPEGRPAAGLSFEGCDRLTLILAAGTSYLPDSRKGWRGAHPHNAVTRRIGEAAKAGYDALLAVHTADHRSLFRRFQVDLGTTPPEPAGRPTDARLVAYTRDKAADPDLEELFCQYGRYLLIASSRPGSLPANLQGLWNDSNDPPWRSDYHSNINIQMNYWLAEPTNLSECHRPLIDYVRSLREVRALRTREKYGPATRGWTVQTENNIYGGSSWRWNPPGSAWYAQHLWEHALLPGTPLPEETVILPRTCHLTAALRDSSGNAQTERPVFLHVDYEDGSKTDFAGRTDKQGKFDEKGRVRAAAFVLEIRSATSKVLWKSQRLDGSAGEVLDLGEIVLDGADG